VPRIIAVTLLSALSLGWPGAAGAVEHVTLRRDGKQVQIAGRLILKAADGGLLVQTRDGEIWAVPPEEQVRHTRDNEPFEPLSAEELGRKLLAELPRGFEVHHTARYVIVHGTSREYAQWCGALLERLHGAFVNFWSRKGLAIEKPEFPLSAIVFGDRASYTRHAQAEVGEGARSIIGYYSLKTNRMTMYDLSEATVPGRGRGRGSAAGEINRILSQPGAAWNVATIVHEATHQIAFNCGMHARFSACPRWATEGIAMYFETPDLSSAKGWRNIGAINGERLLKFRSAQDTRPAAWLEGLLASDKSFQGDRDAADAYAEAWALTYFLLRQYPKQYAAYLQGLAAKKPLIEDDGPTRLGEFKRAFGNDLEQLGREVSRLMMKVR